VLAFGGLWREDEAMHMKLWRDKAMWGWLVATGLLVSFAGWLWQFKTMIAAVLGW
jgi:hypothetical protein